MSLDTLVAIGIVVESAALAVIAIVAVLWLRGKRG